MKLKWIASIATWYVCVAGYAQERIKDAVMVQDIEIRLNNDCGTSGGIGWVVLDGDDGQAVSATPSKEETCVWTAHMKKEFDAKVRFVSVRFLGRRSDCRYALSVAGPNTRKVATYWFDWDETEAWDVKIDVPRDELPVSYVRVMKQGLGGDDCVEKAFVKAGTPPVRSVSFDRESFILRFETHRPKVTALGLPVERIVLTELPAGNRYRQLFDDTAVVDARALDRARGEAGQAPSTGSNAIDLDYQKLPLLKSFAVTVK
jgi:hypothetical protein